MANYFLKPVYSYIFDESFYNSFEKRMEMQKSIYLLQDLGVSVGDYNFMWYKHGPYSQTLQNDILGLSVIEEKQVIFTEEAKAALDKIKKAINNTNKKYSTSEWLECLGSIHYIKENILSSSASEEEILSELKVLKPHLDKNDDNVEALKTLNVLFA